MGGWELSLGRAFRAKLLMGMRHIAPYDLHSILTIKCTMRAARTSTRTPPGRAGHTIWSPLP